MALALPGAIFVGLLFQARASVATPEYARRTSKECLYCHPKGSWALNDAGKYYKDHKSLKGFNQKSADDPAAVPSHSEVRGIVKDSGF